jgi:hypothetical protein
MVHYHWAFPASTLQNAVLTRPTWDVIDIMEVLRLPRRILGNLYNVRPTHFIQVDIP